MRRRLGWALAASVVLSVAAIWGGNVPHIVSAVEPRLREAAAGPDAPQTTSALNAKPQPPLPAQLPQIDAEQAKRDVFLPFTPPAPPTPPAARLSPPVSTAAPLPQPPQQAPSLNVRFLGSMVTPAGQRMVYLARGDIAVPVAVGVRLDEGYVVTALSAESVTLTYPPLETLVMVPIPRSIQP